MARSTESRMKSEVGETREAKIGTMLAAGFSAESIQQALEAEYTETMPADDPRRKKLKNAKPFDKLARQRQLEAIRSTRRIMLNQDKDTDEWVQVLSTGSEMGSIDNTEMSNIRRFSCGMPSIDFVYGSSAFIWLKDHNEKHPEKGRYRRGDFMPRWVPQSIIDRGWVEDEKLPDNKPWVAETEKEAYAEHGMPHAFLSIWPGSPGVGKSRLAIAVTKTMNELDNLVLYYNGEAERSQFRTWCGHDANPDLFMVSHAEMIRLDQIVRDC